MRLSIAVEEWILRPTGTELCGMGRAVEKTKPLNPFYGPGTVDTKERSVRGNGDGDRHKRGEGRD